MFTGIQDRQMPGIYNYTRAKQTAVSFYCSLGNKAPFVHFNQTHKPGEGHVCLVRKRINRVVCLDDRKAIPTARRKRRKDRASEKESTGKVEQIQKKINKSKLSVLEEVKETANTP